MVEECLLEKENRRGEILVKIDTYHSKMFLMLYTLIVKSFIIFFEFQLYKMQEVRSYKEYKEK